MRGTSYSVKIDLFNEFSDETRNEMIAQEIVGFVYCEIAAYIYVLQLTGSNLELCLCNSLNYETGNIRIFYALINSELIGILRFS